MDEAARFQVNDRVCAVQYEPRRGEGDEPDSLVVVSEDPGDRGRVTFVGDRTVSVAWDDGHEDVYHIDGTPMADADGTGIRKVRPDEDAGARRDAASDVESTAFFGDNATLIRSAIADRAHVACRAHVERSHIGGRAIIDGTAHVERSHIGGDCQIVSNARVHDCVIGGNAVIGMDAQIRNNREWAAGSLAGYAWTIYRTTTGESMLKYGCQTHLRTTWEDAAFRRSLCERYEYQRARLYGMMIRSLCALAEVMEDGWRE